MSDAKVIISAQNNTASGIKSVESSFASFASKASSFAGPIAGIFAVKAIADFGVASFKAFADAETKMAIFNTTLKNMGDLGAKSRQTLLDTADASLKLGFDNEASAQAMARFTQQTGDANEAVKLHQFTMDLARAKNIDYASASELTTLALNGQTRGLRDLGFVADTTKTPLENIALAQKLIQGQAEAFAGTPAGAMQAFATQWDEVKEKIGGVLSEAFIPLVQEITKFISDPKFMEYLKILIDAIGIFLKGSITAITVLIKIWSFEFNALWEGMKLMAEWVTKVFMGTINGITSAVQSVIDTVERLIDAFNRLSIVQGAKSFIGNVIGGAKSVLNAITGKATGGSVSGGTPYMVGENGPELFMPSTGGSIIPNNRLAGAGGGITINISGNTLLDSDSGNKIGDMIMKALKNNLNL